MEVKNLETLGYVVLLTHSSNLEQEFYYAGAWPDPDLHRKYNEGYKVSVYNEVYYTTELALAKVFDTAIEAQQASKKLAAETWGDKPIWHRARALPVRGEEVFKAKLKGPSKIGDKESALNFRAQKATARLMNNAKFQEMFEELE